MDLALSSFYSSFLISHVIHVPDDFLSLGQSIPEVIYMDKKKVEMPQPQPEIPQVKPSKAERPIPPEIYPVIDNDLARDNVENDLPAADLQDL